MVRKFFLRTERKVRIALRAICYQIALDWIADEIIGKNNKYTVCKKVKLENKYPAEISAKFPCKVSGIFFQHAVQYNCETAFTCFVNAKKDLRGLGPTNWRASKKHSAGWTAVSSYVHFVSQMWKQYMNVHHFPDNLRIIVIFCCKILFLKGGKVSRAKPGVNNSIACLQPACALLELSLDLEPCFN